MSTPKIFWTKSERALINQALVDAFADNLNLTRREALSRAQLVLPYERRRKVTDQTAFHERVIIDAAQNKARTIVHTKPAPVKAPEPVEMSLGELFEKLVDEITRRVTIEVRNALAQPPVIVERGYAEDRPAGNAAQRSRLLNATPDKPRKPSVLVVGLNGCQMSAVTNKYPDIKFTFMTAEEALSRNRFNADHTMLMTKFINHSVQNKYRQVPNLHYCNGGVSDLSTLMHVVKTSF
jgi:hypothetical protein